MRRYGIHGDYVKRICFFVVVAFALCFLVPHPACSQDEGRINIHESGNTYKVVYFRNHALSTYNPNIRRAVIAIHGAERGAQFQYNTMRDAACLPGTAPCSRLNSTIIIAPHFMEEDDLAGYDLEDDGLFWSSGWKFGDLSKDTTAHPRADRISSYDVMDRIIHFLATGGSFPNLEDIVIAGHSAGGQYVNRYAAISPVETSIAGTGVDVKYIIANPSSYVYFTDERVYPGTMDTFLEPHPLWSSLCPDPDCCPDDPDPCPFTYDEYIYGLSGDLNTYVGDVVDDIGIPGIMTRYADKKVTILLGRLDKNPCDSSLDKSCGANLEGRYRLERGPVSYTHLRAHET